MICIFFQPEFRDIVKFDEKSESGKKIVKKYFCSNQPFYVFDHPYTNSCMHIKYIKILQNGLF